MADLEKIAQESREDLIRVSKGVNYVGKGMMGAGAVTCFASLIAESYFSLIPGTFALVVGEAIREVSNYSLRSAEKNNPC